ncbi:ABC transporter substrate-binding protein, partial [Candidatus Entotheonella palauensis]|uniref:ABC transporter substrate-binding protein n=1 Tax=Candidatus Entotheonella palauensis TaxID=93172 RepID=UPI000B7E955E
AAMHRQNPRIFSWITVEAKRLIETWQPDVVITADDNAAKYIIKPFYKDHKIPFVFCGINWTVKEYGFPYQNVTGMIEIAPIEPLFDKAETYVKAPQSAFYIGADTLTERKNLRRFQEAATRRGLRLDYRLTSTTEAWLAAYEAAQKTDFVILGSNSGINDWDRKRILNRLQHTASRMSLTNHEWMMPYAMLGLTKIPEEHGEWAAQTALLIMRGVSPSSVPIVPNRKWDIWVNPTLLKAANIQLPKTLVQKGKKVY